MREGEGRGWEEERGQEGEVKKGGKYGEGREGGTEEKGRVGILEHHNGIFTPKLVWEKVLSQLFTWKPHS